MHHNLTTDETVDAKHAFERLAEQHGVRIQHYHCDNGRFADKAFVDDVQMAPQTITFCRVGAHHQNGIVERRILDITENTCTSLLHAAHQWPIAIAANLWLQPIKHVVNIHNSLPCLGKTESPLSKLAGTSIPPNRSISILLVVLYMSSRHLSKPEVHFRNGENAQESAFSCAIPPIMRHLSHWSYQPKPVSSAHNSTVCSMTISTWLEKSRQIQAFRKSRLTFRSPRKE